VVRPLGGRKGGAGGWSLNSKRGLYRENRLGVEGKRERRWGAKVQRKSRGQKKWWEDVVLHRRNRKAGPGSKRGIGGTGNLVLSCRSRGKKNLEREWRRAVEKEELIKELLNH